ncbi:dihydrodipicolinate synthase family protein [Propionibacteriaceae bacterium Y1700]|uniref:dihydrodipicolinate synthase family protein n=1 Tax=Microlunatus sp. Y1700 TaxID=3418487 RepID=UPI003DA7321C
MSSRVLLPTSSGTEAYEFVAGAAWSRPSGPFSSRTAFAAAHVVATPDNAPGQPASVDWESTLAFRRHLWSYGFSVAEAMDTAQRGMGLDWAACQELIARSAAEAPDGRIAAGVGTDHRPEADNLAAVTRAYLDQLAFVQAQGAQGQGVQPIVMASRQLAAVATSAADYAGVYDEVLQAADRPVILHWLGTMFDPALTGYWGSDEVPTATGHFLDLIGAHADKVDGVKVSLLDADHEIALRAALPEGVRLYTGDDFNYPELIKGDGERHSDALLGIFAAIAPAASAALQALDADDVAAYDAAMEPTVALSRHIFATPTFHYKTGIAFLAWLSGHQPGFAMINGQQSGRSVAHLAETARLADQARLFADGDLAADRLRQFLTVSGVTQ